MKIKVSLTDVDFILFFIPTITCLMFWINAFTGSDIQIGSYFDLCITLYLYGLAFKNYRFAVFLSASCVIFISLAYAILLNTTINSAFSYITILNNIIFSLWLFPNFDFSRVNVKELKKHLLIFVSLFIIMYELSVPYAKKRDADDLYYDVHRVYKEGFVISHMACYYLSVSGYILYLLRARIIAFILWIYVASLGPRIGLIYIMVAIGILVLYKVPKIYKVLFKYKYALILFIIISVTMIVSIAIKSLGVEGLMVFTSGRSIFWLDALEQVGRDGLDYLNLIGRGPQYSMIFNEENFGSHIWMHNDFLDVFFNLGIIGIIVYLFSFYNYFKKIDSLYLLFTFLLGAFFNGFLYYDALYVILLSTMFSKSNVTD